MGKSELILQPESRHLYALFMNENRELKLLFALVPHAMPGSFQDIVGISRTGFRIIIEVCASFPTQDCVLLLLSKTRNYLFIESDMCCQQMFPFIV